MATQTGYLVLADISGFTAYLAGVELDHAHEILSNLLETIANRFKSVLTISKFEGDAIFAYLPSSGITRGETLLELLELTYLAFRDRVTAMHRSTTCTCNACRGIPTLDLKFMTHYGEYINQTIAGSQEIIGSDVNLAHRLMKNHIQENTGWRAYALFSAAALQKLGAAPENYHPQTESYEHLGDVATYSYDLHERHKMLVEARRVLLDAKEAQGQQSIEIDSTPMDVWQWLHLPERRDQWNPGTHWTVAQKINGRTQPGAKNHCAHGKDYHESILETIVDLRPFDYYTVEQGPLPLNQMIIQSFILEPLDEGRRTRLTVRGQARSPKGPGLIGKLIYSAMMVNLNNQLLKSLKTHIEQTPPTPINTIGASQTA